MKFRNLTRYKNRKLYCKKGSAYVSFPELVELIREGYTIGVTNNGEEFNREKAIIEGNKILVRGFAQNIDKYSGSSINLVANNFYQMWNLDRQALHPIEEEFRCEH